MNRMGGCITRYDRMSRLPDRYGGYVSHWKHNEGEVCTDIINYSEITSNWTTCYQKLTWNNKCVS